MGTSGGNAGDGEHRNLYREHFFWLFRRHNTWEGKKKATWVEGKLECDTGRQRPQLQKSCRSVLNWGRNSYIHQAVTGCGCSLERYHNFQQGTVSSNMILSSNLELSIPTILTKVSTGLVLRSLGPKGSLGGRPHQSLQYGSWKIIGELFRKRA